MKFFLSGSVESHHHNQETEHYGMSQFVGTREERGVHRPERAWTESEPKDSYKGYPGQQPRWKFL